MNYYKQFAEMLGLKLGQEFVLTDVDGNCFKTKEEAMGKGREIMEQLQKEYEEA